MFIVTVDRQFEAAHQNGPPDGKCAVMHGHSWNVRVEVAMPNDSLDQWGWTLDFSGIKKIIDKYDHQTLNTFPEFERPSAEMVAMTFYQQIDELVTANGKQHMGITIRIDEGHGNSLVFTGPDEDEESEDA